MTRYEIQDIVYQTNDGITFLALDRIAECKVALRRFFPFGQNNGGLDQGKQQAYEEVCEKLSKIRHPGFRSVMDGRADPIDGTPYMVTEWIDGDPLPKALGDQPMEHALVIDLVRRAIEVSIMVSDALGEESVWIDTTPRAVVVDNETSGRGFTFWICPFRWLGTYPMPKDIRSIAELAEDLAGWKSKLYSENMGMGLGGWVKAMKQSPGLPLAEALQRLNQIAAPACAPASAPAPAIVVTKAPILVTASATAPAAAPAIATTSIASQRLATPQKTTQAIQPVMTSAGSGTSGTKAAIWSFAAILIVTLISLAIYQNRSEVGAETARLAALAENSEPELEALSVDADLNMKSDFTVQLEKGKSEQAEERSIQRTRARVPQTDSTPKPAAAATDGQTITPDDGDKIASLDAKTPVKVQGVLKVVKFWKNQTGQSGFTLFFSDPYQKGQIGGAISKGNSNNKLDTKTFDPFIGKEIIIAGASRPSSHDNSPRVDFTSISQISIVSE